MLDVENWLQQKFVSESTKASYRTALTKFHSHFGQIRTAKELKIALK